MNTSKDGNCCLNVWIASKLPTAMSLLQLPREELNTTVSPHQSEIFSIKVANVCTAANHCNEVCHKPPERGLNCGQQVKLGATWQTMRRK